MSELTECYNALELIAKSVIVKSDDGQHRSAKVEKAMRTTAATRTRAGAILARRILQLEQQQAVRAQFAPVLKSMGLDRDDEDDWSSMFSKADDSEDGEEQILHRLAQLKDDAESLMRQLKAVRRG